MIQDTLVTSQNKQTTDHAWIDYLLESNDIKKSLKQGWDFTAFFYEAVLEVMRGWKMPVPDEKLLKVTISRSIEE